MRNPLVAAGLMLALAGCDVATTNKAYTNSAGSLALSRDDAYLYAVDSDNDLMAVVDTQSQVKVADIKVGRAPERVAVGPDDSIYVTNRGSRSVSVIRRGGWSDVGTVGVGVEPVGVAVAPDNSAVYVVSSTALDSPEYGTLTAFDPRSLRVKWTMAVGEEPRGVTLLPGDKALITLFKQGDVVVVDLAKQTVLSRGSSLYEQVNATKLGNSGSGPTYPGGPSFRGPSSFHARAMADAVATPDGKHVFTPVTWAREDAIDAPPSVAGGYYTNGGPCNLGAIATPGIVTFEASENGVVAQADDLTSCSTRANSSSVDFPPSTLASPTSPYSGEGIVPVQGPVAAVVDPTGAWLFVVNQETDNVAILPSNRRTGDDLSFNFTGSTVRSLVAVGSGPNGIALSRDGKRAYVYNAFDHTVSILTSRPGDKGGAASVAEEGRIRVANDVLAADLVAGRKLFFAASDNRLSNTTSGATSCHTCHREGRDDGHTWNFPDGPRQTPALAGRMLGKTAPYHWSGEFSTMSGFLDHTVKARMGGSGLTATSSSQLASYVSALPAPENPMHRDTPTDAQVRGAAVFQKAKCATCHGGEALTDNSFADVGTFVRSGANPDDLKKLTRGFNVPSLLGLSRTAPFLHDGSALTLQARIERDRTTNKHGETAHLSNGEVDDLVAYLQRL